MSGHIVSNPSPRTFPVHLCNPEHDTVPYIDELQVNAVFECECGRRWALVRKYDFQRSKWARRRELGE